MENSKFQKFYPIILSFMLSLGIAIIIFVGYLLFSLIFHESGHILGGVIYDIFVGRPIQHYTFSIRISLGPISIPKQTSILNYPAPNYPAPMILGGPFTYALLITLITALIYVKFEFKKKEYLLLIPIYAIVTAIINDYICGTDHLSQNALYQCQDNIFLSLYLSFSFVLLIAIFVIILYPYVRAKTEKLFCHV